MFGTTKQTRRWRQKGKRGVSPIIATILLVAITVVLAAVLYILISGLTKGPGNTPLGTALAMSPAKEQTAGAQHWYNFSVVSASGGLVWNDMVFQFQTSTGGIITVTAPTITVIGISGANVATYSGGAWTAGGTVSASNQQQLIVQSTSNLASSGDVMVVLGGGTFSGSISVAIP
ncbi:MAG: type IV pilin [Thermoplasmata archaeon]|nr:type IV pilin [Thermoplasmata archaeon]